jgi:hypothetical protein
MSNYYKTFKKVVGYKLKNNSFTTQINKNVKLLIYFNFNFKKIFEGNMPWKKDIIVRPIGKFLLLKKKKRIDVKQSVKERP